MKTYRVHFTFHHAGYYDIEAKSAAAAEQRAEERFTEDDDYHFLEGKGFETYSVKKIG